MRRHEQLTALGIVFTAMDADAIMVIEAPDGNRRRDGAAALELLYICRAVDDDRRAREAWAAGAVTRMDELGWRIQDPARWLGPLRPWPAGVAATRSAA